MDDRGLYERLLNGDAPDSPLWQMFEELRALVASWAAWPRERRPTPLQVAVALWSFAAALAVKHARWPDRDA